MQTVTNEFLAFYVGNLKIALFCNTFVCKLKVFCSPKLKSDLLRPYIIVGRSLFNEITNKFIENTDHITLN